MVIQKRVVEVKLKQSYAFLDIRNLVYLRLSLTSSERSSTPLPWRMSVAEGLDGSMPGQIASARSSCT